MSSHVPHTIWFLALGLSLACGVAKDGLYDVDSAPEANEVVGAPNADAPIFPGAGTSGAALPLAPGVGPETTGDCSPEASTNAPAAAVQTVCFFSADEPNVPAATIEQVVEVVGNAEWVHIRLTLNPTFVDNSYGATAIGWNSGEPTAPAPVPAPTGDERRPKPPKAAKGAHSFKDLVGSDHAEMQLLAGNGDVVLHFKLDYLSESATAASGYASLGVSGGEGDIFVGEPTWILGSTTSMDRNLNACGLGDYVTDSPGGDLTYSTSPSAPNWDYRVIYEVWVSTEAFGGAGFGSALIESVHASPSKTGENTETVLPAPCPPSPGAPESPEPVPRVLTEIR